MCDVVKAERSVSWVAIALSSMLLFSMSPPLMGQNVLSAIAGDDSQLDLVKNEALFNIARQRAVDRASATSALNSNEIAIAMASKSPPREQSKYSGRQLFEHEWESRTPAGMTLDRVLPARQATEARLTQDTSLSDGLGPLYNAKSCVACHVAGGGSGVEHNVTLITIDPRTSASGDGASLVENLRDVFPGVLIGSFSARSTRVPSPNGSVLYNTVVHDLSTRAGYDKIRAGLAAHVPGGIDDAWFVPAMRTSEAIAKQPVVAGRNGDVDFYLSQRNAPPLFGLGLIDSITIQRLQQIAKTQAAKSDGKITGRVAGKFGWQGQTATLSEFVLAACAGELGLNQVTVSQASDPADPTYTNLGADMTVQESATLTQFVSTIPRPIEAHGADQAHQDVLAGERLFNSVGCIACHVADVRPVSGIFSDLLLHDMGSRLQSPSPAPIGSLVDVEQLNPLRLEVPFSIATSSSASGGYYQSMSLSQRMPAAHPFKRPAKPVFPRSDFVPEGGFANALFEKTWDALQREWKTPPLWGVKDTGPYLHDGRATTIEDAILWHGGESDTVRKNYEALSQRDKQLVLAFLDSLRAPNLPGDSEAM